MGHLFDKAIALIRSPDIQKASTGTSDETGKAKIVTSNQTDKAKISTSDHVGKAEISTSQQADNAKISTSGRLPEIPSLLNKPSKVVQELTRQISSLKEHLAEAEAHSHHEVAHRKTEYEAVLEQQ